MELKNGLSSMIVLLLTVLLAGATTLPASTDVAVGEQHEMAFPADQTLDLVEGVLRGEGILFDVLPDNSIVTLWKPADNPAGFFGSMAGRKPRYRYEISIIPDGGSKSKVIVNVRTEYVPEPEISKYKASQRFNIFQKLDQLAAELPPARRTPNRGGVNFVLLPNEDLRGLAKRVTGNPDNWKAIADRNGLNSPTDITPFQTIWVPDSLIKAEPQTPKAHAP
jgi:LysM domain-containing protein